MSNMNDFLKNYVDIAPEVRRAQAENRPVVALESTIIFHGMPYPENVRSAEKCEAIIRENGAVPATTAVVDGRIKVGLSKEDTEYLFKTEVWKLSRRDLAQVVAAGKSGATTVASTLIIAEMAGIPVFATGGVGGVHRGAGESFDVSADLPQIARSNVCVVCAGAKSILDIGATLEYLETSGVPVVGWQTSKFPAFFTRDSGYKVDYEMPDAESAARMMKAKWDMGLRGGILLACPVPEAHAMDEAVINAAIEAALAEAEKAGIHGKESTPFLLGAVLKATGGASLRTNMHLVANNCLVAAKVAAAYQGLRQ